MYTWKILEGKVPNSGEVDRCNSHRNKTSCLKILKSFTAKEPNCEVTSISPLLSDMITAIEAHCEVRSFTSI